MIEILGQGLIWFFTGIPGIGEAMAFVIAIALFGAAVAIALYYWRFHHQPLVLAIKSRNEFIAGVIGGMQAKSSEARGSFADRFFEIDEKMLEVSHPEAHQLRRAWEEYRETIVDQNAQVIQNTVRPEHFFVGLAHGYRAIGWFANIAIAVGLLFTFLGIIAALSTLDLSGGPEAMQTQLNGLMQVAGAKFWASVGGILASILLRSVDYRFSSSLETQLYRLCDLLEHGMVYLPPQRIASEQLRQLEEQTPAIKTFAEQIAIVLDEALEKQFTPMVSSLGSIREGIERISGDGGAAIHKVVSERAGAELGNLSEAIGAMTLTLATMAERIEMQTSSADQQIEEAVRRFSQASEEMRAAFSDLNGNFAAVAERLRADSEHASEQARQRMSDLIERLGASLDEMRSKMAQSAETFGRETQNAARNAAQLGQNAMQESFEAFVRRFNDAGEPLVEEMRKASTSIGTAANSLESGNRALGDYSRGIADVADRSSDIATSLGTLAKDVREATNPIKESASSIERALVSMSTAIADDARSAEANREEMRSIAQSLKATSEAAEQAWADYRARFNEVDEALGRALTALVSATDGHAQNINDRVAQVDETLGKGVSQLAAALRPLENLSDTVEDLSSALQRAQTDKAA